MRIDNSLHNVALDLGRPDSFGSTRAINCWHLYPVAADGCVKTHDPQPCIDKDPPAYNVCVAPASTGLVAPGALEPAPQRTDTWYIPPTPKKRKASASSSRRREAPSKARLDELNETATQPASTAEVLKWAGRVGAAAFHRPRSTNTNTNTSTSAADGSDSDLPHFQSVETFHRPDVRAPSTAMPLTSLWRTELTETNAIFFDMVVVLQRALQSETRAHETYLSSFLHLGLTALCPQEQAYDAFVKARDRLAERVIADAGKRASRNAWDTEPFPSAPDKQVEYVRCWVNEHLQVNTNMDLFYKLINFS
ncbi:hypothetical protein IWX90DRAFT_490739 [Phyllosticta citrichinensis]|uniref:Uncharacterized protein n=1 Tax=Phyllosticta citrichinensis TaxID=1130410 RepID=A0ABR1XFG2_9PEZI